MTDRIRLDDLNSAQLDALYDELDSLRSDRAAVLREAADDLATAFGDPMAKHIGLLGAAHLRRRAREAEAGRPDLRRMADEVQAEPDIAAADNPTQLRWGLNDVLWGDDDTVTVLLSGPAREPYWLELDPERAAALKQDLTGPKEN